MPRRQVAILSSPACRGAAFLARALSASCPEPSSLPLASYQTSPPPLCRGSGVEYLDLTAAASPLPLQWHGRLYRFAHGLQAPRSPGPMRQGLRAVRRYGWRSVIGASPVGAAALAALNRAAGSGWLRGAGLRALAEWGGDRLLEAAATALQTFPSPAKGAPRPPLRPPPLPTRTKRGILSAVLLHRIPQPPPPKAMTAHPYNMPSLLCFPKSRMDLCNGGC